jgi:hypothetical protein
MTPSSARLRSVGRASLLGLAIATGSVVGIARAAGAPVVLELFQSQGCSSCPPADANINAIADRPGVLALSFGVTYWDDLGWKDTFAKPQYTARQWDYAHAMHHDNVATPQVVVNGRSDIVGNDRGQLEQAIRTAGHPDAAHVAVGADRATVSAGASPGRSADVWLVRYDPRVQEVPIQRGENGGRTLPHKDVVRQLVRLGGWTGSVVSYALPRAPEAGLRTAVLVQGAGGGPILGVGEG